MAYITATHVLERIHPKTLVVNDPAMCATRRRSSSSREFEGPDAADADHLRPPRDRRLPRQAQGHHRQAALRQWRRRASSASSPTTKIWARCWRCSPQFYREPVIVQRYVPEVRQGDKRIILVDGEFAGAINRVPAAGEARSNMHVGGRPEATTLTAREKDICAAIGPELKTARPDLHRHRRDRRLSDRDQRHLADRHPGSQTLRRRRHRRADLGRNREAEEGLNISILRYARPCAGRP